MIRVIIVCILLLSSQVMLIAQEADRSIAFKALLPAVNVNDAKGLELRITIGNKSDTSLQIYKDLDEGYLFDPFVNFNLIVEKKQGKMYKTCNRSQLYQRAPSLDTSAESYSLIPMVDHADRISLSPGDSMVFHYNIDNVYSFEKGSYRVKCIYRKNILKKDKCISAWVYFNVLTPLHVTRYYSQ